MYLSTGKKAKKADVMKSNWRIEKGNIQLFKKSESQHIDEKSKLKHANCLNQEESYHWF